MNQQPLSVTELTHRIKELLEEDLGQVFIKGEISNLATPRSGHVYFNVKDENSQIASVMFRSVARRTVFDLDNGLEVVIIGRITVYEPRGAYQIIVEDIEPLGSGALQLAFEQLKAKLLAEGLFEAEKKKELPFIPKGIGVVTSATGAAIRDILNILDRRFPSIPILIYPVPVQGNTAAVEIAKAIDILSDQPEIDVMIVGRGGGSIEDLWAFNEEPVARAIFRSKVPIISAVGHETDFTIADFVADLRAPTPSAAAELVVPRQDELMEQLNDTRHHLLYSMRQRLSYFRDKIELADKRLRSPVRQVQVHMQRTDELIARLSTAMAGRIRHHENQLAGSIQSLEYHSPQRRIETYRHQLDKIRTRMIQATKNQVDTKASKLTELSHVLDSASPLSVLHRGYAALTDESGEKLSSVGQISIDDSIRLHLKDGYVDSRVTKSTPMKRPLKS